MSVLAPRIMRGFTLVANDDANLALNIKELALPTLEEHKETFQPGGADGEVEVAGMGTKALVLGFKLLGHTPEVMGLFAGAPGVRHNWTGKQLVTDEETGEEFEHAVDILGRLTKVGPDASQGGKPSEYDHEVASIWAYTEYWNGQVLHRFNLKTGGWEIRNSEPVAGSRASFLFS